MFVAYLRTLERVGMKSIPMRADTGPIGGDLSHEFIILADTGESAVFCHRDFLELKVPGKDVDFSNDEAVAGIVNEWTAPYAATEEMHDEAAWNDVAESDRVAARGIEVGHIFHFGTKYSTPMDAKVTGPDGKDHFVSMGSYGIGPTRLIAAIIEASHDENGIIWPAAVAPFDVGLINMKVGEAGCDAACETLYAQLGAAGLDVLYDDTDQRAGGKFATADLIGLPWQVIIGPRGVEAGEAEIKNRKTGERIAVPLGEVVARLGALHDGQATACQAKAERRSKIRAGRGRFRPSSAWWRGAICVPGARIPSSPSFR